MKIKLTERQRDLLWLDVVDVGADPNAKEPARTEELRLIAELNVGREVEITKFLYTSLVEFADRDADTREQRIYKRLLKNVSTKIEQ